jgi:hypothetical protein
MKRKPKCFIAMAFDHDDTDRLYKFGIAPVLRSERITPIIINRKQFNDDVTSQIITSIQEADLCISDLTYARPSVYYEAGFAERSIPTIYTVRRDHFESTDDLKRVHFDLSVRPIIDWKSSDFSKFRSRLSKRIRATFLRSWKADQEARDKWKEESEDFLSGSLHIQQYVMEREVIKYLRSRGVKDWFVRNKKHQQIKKYKNPLLINEHNYFGSDLMPIYIQDDRNYPIVGTVYARKNLSIKEFNTLVEIDDFIQQDPLIYKEFNNIDKKIDFYRITIMLCINKINVDTFRRKWGDAELAEPNVIIFPDKFEKPWGDRKGELSSTRIFVFIAPIKHLNEITEKLNKCIDHILHYRKQV